MPTDKNLVKNWRGKNTEQESAGPQESLAAPLAPHILVVDDDAIIRQQLEQLFTHGYRQPAAIMETRRVKSLLRCGKQLPS